MISGSMGFSPDQAYKQQLAQGERYRQQSNAANQAAQDKITQDEFTRNALTAQRYALDQSHMMQANPNIPRTITDTSMTIGNGGSSRTASGGGGGMGGRQLPPDLHGRFMPLVELGQQSINDKAPEKVQMGAADYTPENAQAYQDAAFARLKDKSGQLGKGALDSLASTLAGRGISGQSGTFGRGLADIVGRTVQPLADLNVAHLGDEYQAAQHGRDLAENARLANYSGDLNQRSQDMTFQNALNQLKSQLLLSKYQGDISQRGQDLEAIYRLL